MLSNTIINDYIENIPPIPEIVKRCIDALDDKDLVLASSIANEDRALVNYLKSIVNKPIFGFIDEIKNVKQIFGVLGLLKAKQLLYAYYVLLLLPKQWQVFNFNSTKFQDLQANIIIGWSKILKILDEKDKDLIQAISIIPATAIVCEMLFRDVKETVELLREKKKMSYDTILLKMTDRNLFEVASLIAKKWDFSQKTIDFILKMEGDIKFDECFLAISYLKLLIMYEMSKPAIIESGLNDLFNFTTSFDDEIVDNFFKIMQSDQQN